MGTFQYSDMVELFEVMARATWAQLADARRFNLGFSEDTVSDLNMLRIAQSQDNAVKVGRVTKAQERFTGFDWMWLISVPGMQRAIYVVQAKKMRLDNSGSCAYGSLRYPHRPPYQIDILQEFADWIEAVPLYCFYNNVADAEAEKYWHCYEQPEPSQMGCTLVPLDAVRMIHDGTSGRNFRRIHQHQCAVPWRCLFHPQCSKFGFWGNAESPQFMPQDSRRVLDDGVSGDTVFEYFSEALLSGEDTIDLDTAVLQLGLRDLVGIYAAGSFVPFPERVALLNPTI